ncbi:hypothetical protein KEM48_007946 [Puccinia striiformis f. sp. tritici PST-130]|nr:hypothetical protein KEM48_007946 [Puccinia striiformis f. sp. tritici PST-130]
MCGSGLPPASTGIHDPIKGLFSEANSTLIPSATPTAIPALPITLVSQLNMSQPPSRPCPYRCPVRFAATIPYPPPPYRPVASHQYGLRPTDRWIAVAPRTRLIPEDVVMALPTFIPAVLPAALVLSPIRAAVRSLSGLSDPSNLWTGVNRPGPASSSSPANPFFVNPTTPGSLIVHPCPLVGGSRFLNLTANWVVIDRQELPPPAPCPCNMSLPPSFESSPPGSRWSSPSAAFAITGSSSETPTPNCVDTPPVQGAYNPNDYHLLQQDQIFLLLAPAPPLAPFNRYRFGSQAGVPDSMLLACDFVAYCHDFPTFDQAQIDRQVEAFKNWIRDRCGA